MGAGFAVNKRSVNTSVIKDIALTWLLTFPGCGALGFVVTKVFLWVF
jgi:PiT family inorganic phosphate transporter